MEQAMEMVARAFYRTLTKLANREGTDGIDNAWLDKQLVTHVIAFASALGSPDKQRGEFEPLDQKAYPPGATETQKACADIAYINYLIRLIMGVPDAFDTYCKEHDACFPA